MANCQQALRPLSCHASHVLVSLNQPALSWHHRPSSPAARRCTSQPMPWQHAAVGWRPHVLGVVHSDGENLAGLAAVQHGGDGQGLHKLLERAGLHQAWGGGTSTRGQGGARGKRGGEGEERRRGRRDASVRGEPQEDDRARTMAGARQARACNTRVERCRWAGGSTCRRLRFQESVGG